MPELIHLIKISFSPTNFPVAGTTNYNIYGFQKCDNVWIAALVTASISTVKIKLKVHETEMGKTKTIKKTKFIKITMLWSIECNLIEQFPQ